MCGGISLWLICFPDGWWCWASSHVLIGHLHIFFGEISIKVLCQFLNWVVFLLWVVEVLYIFQIQVTYQIRDLKNIFSHSVSYLFTFLIVSSEAKKFKILMKSNLSSLSFIVYTFGVISKEAFPNPRSWRLTVMFSSESFIVLVLTFRFMIHFEFTFAYRMRKGSKFILLHVDIKLSQYVCWLFFPH